MRLHTFMLAGAVLAVAGCSTLSNTVDALNPFSKAAPKAKPAQLPVIQSRAEIARLWQASIGTAGDHVFTPAVVGDQVYVAARDGALARLDNGRQVWRINAGQVISGGVGASDKLVVVGTPKGEVLAFHAEDGRPAWQTRASSEVLAAPAVQGDLVAVRFDNYYLESSLYTSGRVEATVQKLVDAGKTYEQDGALWLRTTDYGDDKDRVMKKSDGTYTYFVPDVAYHIAKWERGFERAINIQGTDHHGTIARVRAGLQAANVDIPEGYPDYLLHTMVRVMRGGEEVKISKRAGSYVTLRDLIDWTSRDAVRFFLISRKADTEFVFDVDLALKAGDENPVFYVQYAHARICSVLAQYGGEPDHAHADLTRLTAPSEAALMLKLADYPDMLARAAAEFAPHDVAFYLRELAAAFHTYYASERFLVDDEGLARARMALLAATAQVLRNALALLGVGAPQAMVREAPVAQEAAA